MLSSETFDICGILFDLNSTFNTDLSNSFSNNTKEYQDEQWLLQSLLRKGELWPRVRDHLTPDEFEVPHYKKRYAKLLEFPDSEFQPFDPLKLEESDPNLFRIVMHLLKEEIGLKKIPYIE